MADYSDILRLIKQEYGENTNAWGGELNEGAIERVSEAFSIIEVTVNGPVTLTTENGIADQSRRLGLIFSGAGNDVVTHAAVEKPYLVINNCAADITMKPAGGTGATIRAGFRGWYYTNAAGTVGYLADMTLDKVNPPTGSVDMNGQKFTNVAAGENTTDGASLANKVHDFAAPTSPLDMNGQKITNAGAATTSTGVATLSNKVHDFAPPTASLDMNGQRITGAGNAVDNQDLVTRADLSAAAFSTVLPGVSGNAGKYITNDGTSAFWGEIVTIEIGDILLTTRDPGATFLAADGSVYLQSAYPDLYAEVGDDYLVNLMEVIKVANPASLPPSGWAVAWSANNRYAAVTSGTTPWVSIYDWNTGSPVKVANPATLPGSDSRGAAWSPNGRYLAVASVGSPYVTIYDWNTGSPVKLSDPATLPANAGNAAAWSPDGRYLAVGHNTTPFITIYDWQTGSPVKISDPSSLPASAGNAAAWSSDGRYLAVPHNTTPYVTIYDWQTGSPVKIADPATLPAGASRGAAWSPDDRYLVITHDTTPYLTIYDFQSGAPVKSTTPADLPAGNGKSVHWSSNGRYLIVTHTTAPFVTIYDWASGAPVKIPTPPGMADGQMTVLSPNMRYLSSTTLASPYINFYDTWAGTDPTTEFRLPSLALDVDAYIKAEE